MRVITVSLLMLAALPGQSARAQVAPDTAEIKKIEAEIAKLHAQLRDAEERLRRAREVVIAFAVKHERSLEDPTFRGIKGMMAMQRHKPGQCVVMGPVLNVAVNQQTKTVFVQGQPEDVAEFKSWVLTFDTLYAESKPPGE